MPTATTAKCLGRLGRMLSGVGRVHTPMQTSNRQERLGLPMLADREAESRPVGRGQVEVRVPVPRSCPIRRMPDRTRAGGQGGAKLMFGNPRIEITIAALLEP